jgi:hypothetical protein
MRLMITLPKAIKIEINVEDRGQALTEDNSS